MAAEHEVGSWGLASCVGVIQAVVGASGAERGWGMSEETLRLLRLAQDAMGRVRGASWARYQAEQIRRAIGWLERAEAACLLDEAQSAYLALGEEDENEWS